MKKVLVTGANGFIGTKLCKKLLNKNFCVHGAVRPGKSSFLPEGVEAVHIKFIGRHKSYDVCSVHILVSIWAFQAPKVVDSVVSRVTAMTIR